jgi:hypothetical protein
LSNSVFQAILIDSSLSEIHFDDSNDEFIFVSIFNILFGHLLETTDISIDDLSQCFF